MTDLAPFAVSLESELDREIEKLIAKIVSGTATPNEREHYSRLAQQRIRLMQARSAGRYDHQHGRLRATG